MSVATTVDSRTQDQELLDLSLNVSIPPLDLLLIACYVWSLPTITYITLSSRFVPVLVLLPSTWSFCSYANLPLH